MFFFVPATPEATTLPPTTTVMTGSMYCSDFWIRGFFFTENLIFTYSICSKLLGIES